MALVTSTVVVNQRQSSGAPRMAKSLPLNVVYSSECLQECAVSTMSGKRCFMCRATAPVQPMPAGSAHTLPEAPLPLHPGSSGGLLGLPLLQPAQCPARKCPLQCPGQIVPALSSVPAYTRSLPTGMASLCAKVQPITDSTRLLVWSVDACLKGEPCR